MLLTNLNDEHLVKLVDESQFLIWGIEGTWHIIGTRHFAFRVGAKEMEDNEDAWGLADWLETTFKKRSPAIGSTLIIQNGEVKEGVHYAKQLADKYFTTIPKIEGITTPFLYAISTFRYRWIKFEAYNVFVNDDYLSILFDTECEPAFSDGPKKPLYMHDGDFLILPISNMDNKVTTGELEAFEELLKSEGINLD